MALWATMAHAEGETREVSLRVQLLETARLSRDLDDAAQQLPHRESTLSLDDATILAVGSVRVAPYVNHRARHAARFARAVFELSGERRREAGAIDHALLFPMLRSCLEDSAALVWLLHESDQFERWTRILRALRTDADFFTRNQILLSDAAGNSGEPDQVLDELRQRMEREHGALSEQVRAASVRLGLDQRSVVTTLRPSEPLHVVFGKLSVTVVTWRLLSDLSHYSYGLSARFDAGALAVDGRSGNELLRVVLSCVNPALDEAIRLLRWAKSAP
ncbi:MAG: hypothetical protein ABI435_10450 [Pseudolysinimonas sp.]